MDANELAKEHGIKKIKDVLAIADKHNNMHFVVIGISGLYLSSNIDEKLRPNRPHILLSELRLLVESWNLVEWHGGLKYAKSYFERNSKEYPDTKGWDILEKAIADVESVEIEKQ